MELDEEDEDDQKPLLEELDIDLKDIAGKVRSVIVPFESLGMNRAAIRESPDFWGPLMVVCVFVYLWLECGL